MLASAFGSSGLMKSIIIRIINSLMIATADVDDFIDEDKDDEDNEDDDDCQSRRVSPSSV